MIKKIDNKLETMGGDHHEKIIHIHETEEVYLSSHHGGSARGSAYGDSSYREKRSQRRVHYRNKVPSTKQSVKKQNNYRDIEGEMDEVPDEEDSREFEDEHDQPTDVRKFDKQSNRSKQYLIKPNKKV